VESQSVSATLTATELSKNMPWNRTSKRPSPDGVQPNVNYPRIESDVPLTRNRRSLKESDDPHPARTLTLCHKPLRYNRLRLDTLVRS
jgi:hypothetical protein